MDRHMKHEAEPMFSEVFAQTAYTLVFDYYKQMFGFHV